MPVSCSVYRLLPGAIRCEVRPNAAAGCNLCAGGGVKRVDAALMLCRMGRSPTGSLHIV